MCSGARRVTLTDRQSALPVLHQNVLLNNRKCHCSASNAHKQDSYAACIDKHCSLSDSNVSVDVLDWGSDIADRFESAETILGADIIYIEETFPLLLKTFLDLTRNASKHCVILLSCRIRYERDERFLSTLASHFTVTRVYDDKVRGIDVFQVVYKTG